MSAKQQIKFSASLIMVAMLCACQPNNSPPSSATASANSVEKEINDTQIVAIEAKIMPFELPQAKVCLAGKNCTLYRIDLLQTNLPWMNQYLLAKLKQQYPAPFTTATSTVDNSAEFSAKANDSVAVTLRYLGQHGRWADVMIEHSHYGAGAAHGTYQHEYIHFDLKKKTTFKLDQVLKADMHEAFLDALYEANQSWLQAHQQKRSDLSLVDNFYFNQKGLVLVYPLYELASYAEGLTELTLPYSMSHEFLQPEYIPSTLDFTLTE